jgi:hypothetical protein
MYVVGSPSSPRTVRRELAVENGADLPHHVDVPPFIASADIVGFADFPVPRDEVERARVVLDVKPIADVLALPVDRQPLARERIEDGQRDQLFGEMIRTIVVGAIRDDHRKAIGALPRFREMIGRSFRGGIGGAGIVRSSFAEQPLVAE